MAEAPQVRHIVIQGIFDITFDTSVPRTTLQHCKWSRLRYGELVEILPKIVIAGKPDFSRDAQKCCGCAVQLLCKIPQARKNVALRMLHERPDDFLPLGRELADQTRKTAG